MVNSGHAGGDFFALIGMALTRIHAPRAQGLISLLEGVADIMMVIVGFAMRIAPYAVLALIFNVTVWFGMISLMKLLLYVVVVMGGYLVLPVRCLPGFDLADRPAQSGGLYAEGVSR